MLRRVIRERDRYQCQLCGELQSDETFCVHHIDYNKENCNPDNLITLCKMCHSKTNSNREIWIKFFNIPKEEPQCCTSELIMVNVVQSQ
jgi:5-methylcytosine-specific restriction endonuclease McrA